MTTHGVTQTRWRGMETRKVLKLPRINADRMIGCGDGCGASGTDKLTNSRRGSVTVFEAACKMGLEGIVSKRRGPAGGHGRNGNDTNR